MKKLSRKVITLIVVLALVLAAAVSAYALNGYQNVSDQTLALNNLANYNIINCNRIFSATAHRVTASNTMTWYTHTGTATELAYCNAITGSSTVSINGHDSSNEYMGQEYKTVYFIGQDISSGVTCSVQKLHNLNLVVAYASFTASIYTPDGNFMTSYYKAMTIN